MFKYIFYIGASLCFISAVNSQDMDSSDTNRRDSLTKFNHYILLPFTYGQKKESGYFKNNEVVWSEIGVGITKNISISGGIAAELFFRGQTPVWLASTVSVPLFKEKINFSLIAVKGKILSEKSSIGAILGLISFGSPTRNVSVGYGRGFKEIKDGFLGWNQVTLNKIIGSERVVNDLVSFTVLWKTGKKGYWITDNLLLLEKSAYPTSYSILARRRVFSVFSLDYGLIIPIIKSDLSYALPWLGFIIPF